MREMKDSGIEWIGKIPKSWSLNRLKNICATSIKDGTHQTPTYTDEDKGVPFLSSKDVTKGYIEWKDIKYITPSLHKQLEKEIKPIKNDILLAKNGTTGVAAIVDTDTTFDIYVTLAVIRVNNKIAFPKYMLYVINSLICKNQFNERLVGIGVPNLHLNIIKNTKIILPFMREQHAIVDFLDSKCSEIDELIADIEKQIATLKEYKKSVITQAVTKGLDPNVEMKDSGIEWIGKIPRYWIYPKLTYILDTEHEYPIGDGDHGTIKANNYVQEGIPFIRVQNLGFATPLQLDDVVYITKRQNVTIKNSTLKPDDILFAKTGATIGKVGIVPKELFISNTTSHVGKITVNQKIIVPRFLFYALSSTVGYRLLWDIASQKSTRPELSIEEIKRLHIILPDSLQEQQAIVDYLDAKCADIDAAITGKQKQLDVLKEYKKSLIYEYVTGKKEVPCHE